MPFTRRKGVRRGAPRAICPERSRGSPGPESRGRTARRRPRVGKGKASIACGVDVVELSRFRQAIARGGNAFMRRVFTAREAAYARARRRTRLLHLAGRFAAKEAVIKALSQLDPHRVPAMHQIEVCNDRLGRPSIVLHDPATRQRKRFRIHISLSHVDTVAVASAIVVVG